MVAANRLAKDAQGAGDAAVNLALRALGKSDGDLAKQDLAAAQGAEAQLKFGKDRFDYVRTDALFKKRGIQASQEKTLSVAKQHEYVTYLSVVANYPDAQALLDSPGVNLNASSGDSNATLKLSVEKVSGLEQRQFEPVTSSRSAGTSRPAASSLDERQLRRFRHRARTPGDVCYQCMD